MRLARNLSIFTFFNLVNAGIPFLLLPILTTYLSASDYGIIDIFNGIVKLFTPILGLSIIYSINRFYFEDDIDLKVFVNTIFKSLVKYSLYSSVIIILLIIIIGDNYLSSFGLPVKVLIYATIYILFSQLSEIILILWRASYKTVYYGVFRVSKTIIDIALSVLLIVQFDYNWQGRIAPQTVISILFGLFSLYILFKQKYIFNQINFNKDYQKKALSYSLPLIFHSLSGYVIATSDRFFILFIEGIESTGVYGVAYQIGMVIGLFQNSFNQAWTPFFFSSLNKKSVKLNIKIVKITYVYFILLIFIVFVFYFITPLLYKYLIGSQFQRGIEIVVWILLGYAFNGMYKMMVNYLFYIKRTKEIAIYTILAAILNLILNYFLITLNGMIGAAQATAISFLFLFIVVSIAAKNAYQMPWSLKHK